MHTFCCDVLSLSPYSQLCVTMNICRYGLSKRTTFVPSCTPASILVRYYQWTDSKHIPHERGSRIKLSIIDYDICLRCDWLRGPDRPHYKSARISIQCSGSGSKRYLQLRHIGTRVSIALISQRSSRYCHSSTIDGWRTFNT